MRAGIPADISKVKVRLLDFGVTFFFQLGIHNIAALGFGLARYRKTEFLEFPIFDERAVIRGVVLVPVTVLFLLGGFGLVDFKGAAQVQLVQIFVMRTRISTF